MAELLQRVQRPRHRPARQRPALPAQQHARQRCPGGCVHTGLRQLQCVERPATTRGQQHVGALHALRLQPVCGFGRRRLRQRQALAAAAHGGQQVGRIGDADQHAGAGRRLFQRLQQRVARLQVDGLGRVHEQDLAAAARRGPRDPVDGRAHLADADLAARLLVVLGLVVGQHPAQRPALDFGQQHEQVRVQLRLHQAAAAAVATGPLRTGCRLGLAQPGLGQCQAERQRADAGRGVQHQRMATLPLECVGQRRRQPRQGQAPLRVGHLRQRSARAHHQARDCTAASTWVHTCCGAGMASSCTKRCGAASARSA